jgi:hypothetical protein
MVKQHLQKSIKGVTNRCVKRAEQMWRTSLRMMFFDTTELAQAMLDKDVSQNASAQQH